MTVSRAIRCQSDTLKQRSTPIARSSRRAPESYRQHSSTWPKYRGRSALAASVDPTTWESFWRPAEQARAISATMVRRATALAAGRIFPAPKSRCRPVCCWRTIHCIGNSRWRARSMPSAVPRARCTCISFAMGNRRPTTGSSVSDEARNHSVVRERAYGRGVDGTGAAGRGAGLRVVLGAGKPFRCRRHSGTADASGRGGGGDVADPARHHVAAAAAPQCAAGGGTGGDTGSTLQWPRDSGRWPRLCLPHAAGVQRGPPGQALAVPGGAGADGSGLARRTRGRLDRRDRGTGSAAGAETASPHMGGRLRAQGAGSGRRPGTALPRLAVGAAGGAGAQLPPASRRGHRCRPAGTVRGSRDARGVRHEQPTRNGPHPRGSERRRGSPRAERCRRRLEHHRRAGVRGGAGCRVSASSGHDPSDRRPFERHCRGCGPGDPLGCAGGGDSSAVTAGNAV